MSEVRRQAALMPRPNWGWQDDAACRGKEVVLFFGPDGERQPERDIRERKAKVVCASCPVRTECLSYAVTRPEKYGTWGGLNEDERASERRRPARGAAAAGDPGYMRRCWNSPGPRIVRCRRDRQRRRDPHGRRFRFGDCVRCFPCTRRDLRRSAAGCAAARRLPPDPQLDPLYRPLTHLLIPAG
jgi:WhiB family transcriptional regulator, redox-sensing transcriptional regulator